MKELDFDLNEIEAYAAQGLTIKQIADCIDVGRSTFYDHMEKDPDIRDSVKRGRSKGIGTITNSLFNSAKGGNVTAQIFYLKNRQPDKWRDRRRHEHVGADDGAIEMAWTVEVVEPDHDDPAN